MRRKARFVYKIPLKINRNGLNPTLINHASSFFYW